MREVDCWWRDWCNERGWLWRYGGAGCNVATFDPSIIMPIYGATTNFNF
jgi:hypothetical protein